MTLKYLARAPRPLVRELRRDIAVAWCGAGVRCAASYRVFREVLLTLLTLRKLASVRAGAMHDNRIINDLGLVMSVARIFSMKL